MNRVFGVFLSFEQSMFNCFLWGISFLNAFSREPEKSKHSKLLKWLKISLLKSLSSKYAFIYFPFLHKKNESIVIKSTISKKSFLNWKIIKKSIKKNFFDSKNIFFKKKILDYFSNSLWEMYGKCLSLFPKNFKNNPNYGENLIEWVQGNERGFSIDGFKSAFFKRNIFIGMIKKYRLIYFQNYFQSIPEHINDLLSGEIFSQFFTILTSIFFTKNQNKILLKHKICFKTYLDNKEEKKIVLGIKNCF